MSRWLALDTSTEVLSLALGDGQDVVALDLPGGAASSAQLIPQALSLLARAGWPLGSLDGLVFGRGPGSFTGVRTACSVVQGLALGADLPVLPMDGLLAVAEDARSRHAPDAADWSCLALLDARMGEVYAAAYDWTASAWQARSVCQVLPPAQLACDAGRLMVGNVFALGTVVLPEGQVAGLQAMPSATALLRLTPARWAREQVPADQAMPLYVRDKVAQTTEERLAARAAQGAARP